MIAVVSLCQMKTSRRWIDTRYQQDLWSSRLDSEEHFAVVETPISWRYAITLRLSTLMSSLEAVISAAHFTLKHRLPHLRRRIRCFCYRNSTDACGAPKVRPVTRKIRWIIEPLKGSRAKCIAWKYWGNRLNTPVWLSYWPSYNSNRGECTEVELLVSNW